MRRAPAPAGALTAFVLVLLASAVNLRTPLTSVSAALDEVTDAYRLSPVLASVLVSLPVVCFALGAPVGPWLARRMGVDRAIVALQVLLAAALLVRPLTAWLLLAGTVVIAVAITGISILASAVFRRGNTHSAAVQTSLLTGILSAGAAIGALFSLPLIDLTGGSVPLALAAWAVPAIATAAALAVIVRRQPVRAPVPAHAGAGTEAGPRLLRSSTAWQLATYFGVQSMVFYGVTGWLPTLLRDRGVEAQSAAVTYVVVSIVGLAGSLLSPRLAVRPERRPPVVLVVAALGTVGVLGLAFGPLPLRLLFAVLLGLSQGGAFALSLAFVVFRAATPAVATSLSAFTQGVGYGIA
ncbi:MAG TPA: MFS transporter, partial [Candidatus Nanopelagicales bacterium]|nr:MFS transporter [Candidatus Nanopelagicales bacterium]